jgi:chromosome segregation ATPase
MNDMTVKVDFRASPTLPNEPMSEEKLENLKSALTRNLISRLPEINEHLRGMVEANKKIALGRAMQASGSRELKEAENEIHEAEKEINAARNGLKEVAKERQDRLTKQFYSIFNGKKQLPIEILMDLLHLI